MRVAGIPVGIPESAFLARLDALATELAWGRNLYDLKQIGICEIHNGLDPNLGLVGTELNTGRSHYHSFQFKLEKRLSHGLSFLTAYTFSKVINRGSQFRNPDFYLADPAPAGFDTPQRLTFSY